MITDVTKKAALLPVCEKNFPKFEAAFAEHGYKITFQKNNYSQMPIFVKGKPGKVAALKAIGALGNAGVVVFGYSNSTETEMRRMRDVVTMLGYKIKEYSKAGFKVEYINMEQVFKILNTLKK